MHLTLVAVTESLHSTFYQPATANKYIYNGYDVLQALHTHLAHGNDALAENPIKHT